MVAVLSKQVVCGALEFLRDLLDYSVDLGWRGKGKAVEDLALECPSRRLGLGLRPVDAGDARPVMPTVCVLLIVYNNPGV